MVIYKLLGTLMSGYGLLSIDVRYIAAILLFIFLVIRSTLHLETLNDTFHLPAHSYRWNIYIVEVYAYLPLINLSVLTQSSSKRRTRDSDSPLMLTGSFCDFT